jgi:hypothetical protein
VRGNQQDTGITFDDFDISRMLNGTELSKSIVPANQLTHYTSALILGWAMTIVFSAAWNIYQTKQTTRVQATAEARSHFNKDQAFRFWSTSHGGVYVPTDERIPPNPYLKHLPERDITMPSGKKLTLMNPAYMLRQMMDEYSQLYDIKGRITSLKPFRLQNAPSDWSRQPVA